MGKKFTLGITLFSLILDVIIIPGLFLLYGFLWKQGGFEDEIMRFSFTKSVFDVAVLSAVRGTFFVILYTFCVTIKKLPIVIVAVLSTLALTTKITFMVAYNMKYPIPYVISGLTLVSPWIVLLVSKLLESPRDQERNPLLPTSTSFYRPITPKSLENNALSINEPRYTTDDRDDDLEPKMFRTESVDMLSDINPEPITFNLQITPSDEPKKEITRTDFNIPLTKLVYEMSNPEFGIEVKDRFKMLKTSKQSFIGSEAVIWVHDHLNLENKGDAIHILQELLDKDYIQHTKSHIIFKDSPDDFYQWTRTTELIIDSWDHISDTSHITRSYFHIFTFWYSIQTDFPLDDCTHIDPVTKNRVMYLNAFKGQDAIDWFVLNKKYFSEEHALTFMNLMLICDFVYDLSDPDYHGIQQTLKEVCQTPSRMYFDVNKYYRVRVHDSITPTHATFRRPALSIYLTEECYDKILYLIKYKKREVPTHINEELTMHHKMKFIYDDETI